LLQKPLHKFIPVRPPDWQHSSVHQVDLVATDFVDLIVTFGLGYGFGKGEAREFSGSKRF